MSGAHPARVALLNHGAFLLHMIGHSLSCDNDDCDLPKVQAGEEEELLALAGKVAGVVRSVAVDDPQDVLLAIVDDPLVLEMFAPVLPFKEPV